MTVNELIINTLSGVAPTCPWGIEETDANERDIRRIVFNYSTVPRQYCDNSPLFELYVVQIHYFCPYADDSLSVRENIKQLLYSADFSFPTEITVSEKTEAEQHYCFECEFLKPVWEDD